MKEFIFTEMENQIKSLIMTGLINTPEEIAKQFKISTLLAGKIIKKINEYNEYLEETRKVSSKREDENITKKFLDRNEAHGMREGYGYLYDNGVIVDLEEPSNGYDLENLSKSKREDYYDGENEYYRMVFERILTKLNPKNQMVLSLKSGFFDGVKRADIHIAKELDISEEEVVESFGEILGILSSESK